MLVYINFVHNIPWGLFQIHYTKGDFQQRHFEEGSIQCNTMANTFQLAKIGNFGVLNIPLALYNIIYIDFCVNAFYTKL